MEPRKVRLPSDIQYCLDGAIECGEIDGMTYVVLDLFAPVKDVIKIVDRYSNYRRRLDMALDLCSLADGILNKMPDELKGIMIYPGLSFLDRQINDLARCLSDFAITDITSGGAMEEFKKDHLEKLKLTKKMSRRIHSRKFIKRYVKENGEAIHMRTFGNRLGYHLTTIDPKLVYDSDIFERFYEDRKQSELAMYQNKKLVDAKKSHKVLIKSSNLGVSVFGVEAISRFARGEPIKIVGNEVIFEVSRDVSITEIGHGALDIWITDLKGVRLASICFFIENTPSIDQIIGLSLHIAAGEEKEVISTANVITHTEAGMNHPIFAEKYKKMLERAKKLKEADFGDIVVKISFERDRNKEYWEETGDMWKDRLGIFVCSGPRLLKFKSSLACAAARQVAS